MVEGLLVLLLCQAVGTLLADWLHLQVPGAVLGMLLLLALALATTTAAGKALAAAAVPAAEVVGA